MTCNHECIAGYYGGSITCQSNGTYDVIPCFSFSTQKTITTQTNDARSVYAADIDGDGEMDVLSASYMDDKIAWYENTDGHGTFSTQKTITTQACFARSVYAADIDGDGDMDVLSASLLEIAWYENTDGQGTF